MKTNYFMGKGYHAVSDQSPNGMEGVLFMGIGGETPATVKERIYTREEIAKFAPISAKDLPEEWRENLGYRGGRKEKQRAEHERKQRIIIFSIVLIVSLLHILLF